MTAPQRGAPPEKNEAGPRPGPAPTTTPTAAKSSPLARRRAASQRLAILATGRSDPWSHAELPLTDHQAAQWRETVAHLRGIGLTPIVSAEVARGLWRCGGPSRELLAEVVVSR